ncbi:MAG TPA: thioredoxin domain-containing protein [Longimicrobiaceae bacterium]|nr:thioredoxin domain-containing protein [Longimicrobiaceae bacterium]
MRLKEIIETGSTIIITAIAVVMAGVFVVERRGNPQVATYETAQTIEEWQRENDLGVRTGPSDATVVITEFIDYQCPFCAALAPTIDSISSMFPDEVAVVMHHFPLPTHGHAVPAAIAAECAAEQDRFWPMHGVLLSNQSSFGTRPWQSFAEDAGVGDLGAFTDCMERPADSFERIELGRAVGERTGVTGTPTTWVNGRVLRATVDQVRDLLERLDG